MKVAVRLRIVGQDSIFMGKGVRQLLDAIEQTSSIRQATILTGISYPKALRMIKTLHKELNFEVVTSNKGGFQHGGTVLTARGKKMLEAYRRYEKDVQDYAVKKLNETFVPVLFNDVN